MYKEGLSVVAYNIFWPAFIIIQCVYSTDGRIVLPEFRDTHTRDTHYKIDTLQERHITIETHYKRENTTKRTAGAPTLVRVDRNTTFHYTIQVDEEEVADG